MRRVAVALCAVSLCLAWQVSLPGQETTASIAGVVVAANGAGEPLRRAVVFLRRPDSSVQISVITDEQGRFSFSNLSPGRYMLSALKPAYLTMSYGARRPGRPGTPISVTAGQHLDGLRLVLARGAVLSGTVRDLTGTPVANTTVTVAPVETASGTYGGFMVAPFDTGAEGVLARRATTDDRGVYRAYGLVAGEYIIAASPPPDMRSAAAVSRRSAAELDAALSLLRPGAGRAGTTPAARVVAEPANRERFSYGATFYPGTPISQDAGRIRVAAGEIREGLDFWFDLVPAVKVEAQILWPEGAPRETLSLSLNPIGPPLPVFSPPRPERSADGLFSYSNVTPGRYVLSARVGADQTSLWARTDFLVNGADVTGITLALQHAMSLSGRVAFEASAATSPIDLTGIRLTLDSPESSTAPRSVAPDASGAFTIIGIMPGTLSLSTVLPPAISRAWWLKSAVADGRDLLDMPLEFGVNVRDVKGVVLTFTDRRTELTGRLQTAAGQPATEYFVIVFSADRAHWFPKARRTRAVRPASDGIFSVTELPAGAYLVAAVTDVEPDEWQRASFLEQLVPLSVPVTVRDGATARQDLQIAR